MKLGRYVHFKNKFYVVIGVGRRADTDSEEIFVTYVSEADASVWVRSLADFTEYINRPEHSYRGPRFMKIPENVWSESILSVLRSCFVCGKLVGDDSLEWNESGTEPLHRGECVKFYVEKVLGK